MKISASMFDPPSRCGYLPDRDWRLEYRIAFELSAEEYAERMLRGWRHFGRALFRPRCRGCTACQPIRVVVDRFRPDRSQRRAWKANRGDLRLEVADPAAGPGQLDLYRRYHAYQEAAKLWPSRQDEDQASYHESFVDNPFSSTREWRFFLGESLVGVGYVDDLPVGPSAITFIHDPAHRSRSLGTYNVLALIEHARVLGQPHVYLGYYVAGCASMAYKARFAPNQTLGPDGRWCDFLE
ncbi:arginyltransferase [Tundrisphaera lichenicola]|uniref:arginyltransferase n=1 Tax=Tundrisphaera lichenicola TaxID=2029860 RepID=UPI003EB722DA